MRNSPDDRAGDAPAPEEVGTIHPQLKKKHFNDLLRIELQAYKDDNNYSMTELASELGVSSTVVSKYLAGKPEGDVTKLEGMINDVLRSAMRRAQAKAEIIENNVTEEFAAGCRQTRSSKGMGLIYGDSGVGKTASCEHYVARNPTTISICVNIWESGAEGVKHLLWEQLQPRVWEHWNDSHINFIVRKLKGSSRLLIVDNCHKLLPKGLDAIFDLHDRTGIPIVLVGFQSIMAQVRKDQQRFTRVGVKVELKLADTRKLAEALLKQYVPEGAKELYPLAEQVVMKHGYGRALRCQLLLARDIKENHKPTKEFPTLSWSEAFTSAHLQLFRDYRLED